MKHSFDTVWVRRGLEHLPEVEAYSSGLPKGVVRFFDSIRQVVAPGVSMGQKIERGKRVLVIDRRSKSLLDEFVNHDMGSLCPSFHKLVPGTNCPYRCEYCFLAGTYRACRPFVCVYVFDFPKLEKEVRRLSQDHNGILLVNAGEMSDPLACDVLGYMPRLVEVFAQVPNAKLLLVTKSGLEGIGPLLRVDHNGCTICSWSLTCEEVVARYEHGNEPIAGRLAAARAAQDVGYEVRFRLDPFLLVDGWQRGYARTIDSIHKLGIEPSRFTLGSFRLLGNLGAIISARFPKSDLLDQPLLQQGGKRKRYPLEVRRAIYLGAIVQIRGHFPDVPIALCKETPEMHSALDGLIDAAKCNCLP